jgi:hypothetical protein
MYLETLKEILKEKDKKYLFPCIKDLVSNGLLLSRFSSEDIKPLRQDITQFIAIWFKYIGISSDKCLDWMNEYCLKVLSAISSSSNSQIRHSTKSNIKYIYNSDITFYCRCEKNPFKASCEQNCSVYKEMFDKNKEIEAKEADKFYKTNTEIKDNLIESQRISIRDKYKDQFEEAMEFVINLIKKGISKKDIVTSLNNRGFKTRMGKKWTYSILGNELRMYNKNIEK